MIGCLVMNCWWAVGLVPCLLAWLLPCLVCALVSLPVCLLVCLLSVFFGYLCLRVCLFVRLIWLTGLLASWFVGLLVCLFVGVTVC